MIVFCAAAQDTRTISEPRFPAVCTVLQARVSAGALNESSLDTSTIQSALNSCPAGQAVELAVGGASFLSGASQPNAFITGALTLPKGVTLLIDAGVTLFASRNPRDYDNSSAQTCGTITSNGGGCSAIITANRADGAGIMGYGTIDGRGYLPMLVNGTPGVTWWDLANQANTSGGSQNNPRMIQISNTNGFTLYKITLKNSPNFHVAMGTDQNVTVWGIKIITPYDARNTDGADPGYSSNVTITQSHISNGDDNVAIGGNNQPGASHISVVDNWFGDGHGASIGSYTTFGIANVLFDNITIAGTQANSNANGIRIKSDVSRGGLVQHITYSNFCINSVRAAIVLDPFYTSATGNQIPLYSDITIRNFHATSEGTVKLSGHDAANLTTAVLDNVQIDNIKPSDVTGQYASVQLGPGPVNFASMIKGTGVTVSGSAGDGSPYACPAAVFSPIAGELIPGPQRIVRGKPLSVLVQVFATKTLTYQSYLTQLKTSPNATFNMPDPTGTVTIYEGTQALASVPAAALTSVQLPALTPGTHTFTASYSGDLHYAPITFGEYTVEVLPQPRRTVR
ncbi:MAG TPA: glycosyl hydrolase family 28 protein [Candidatus Limnocylindrales bacterium]|nr:glycosyl hydrolase family 28 protein [Candidatus Limnocylindrales bacterium]